MAPSAGVDAPDGLPPPPIDEETIVGTDNLTSPIVEVDAGVDAADDLPTPPIEKTTAETDTPTSPNVGVEDAGIDAADDLPPPPIENTMFDTDGLTSPNVEVEDAGIDAADDLPPPPIENTMFDTDGLTSPDVEVEHAGVDAADDLPPPPMEETTPNIDGLSLPNIEVEHTGVDAADDLPPPPIEKTMIEADGPISPNAEVEHVGIDAADNLPSPPVEEMIDSGVDANGLEDAGVGTSDPISTSKPTNEKSVPYQGAQPFGIPDDLVIPNIMQLEDTDERLWVPQADNVWFRPLLFNTSNGYFVNILKVTKSGVLSRHKYTGTVHAFTLRGKWHYLEHNWWATAGGYSMEPPGETHTLEVPDDVDEMYTLFHVTGACVYVDPFGKAERIEDVFTKLEMARNHYEKVGLGKDYVDQFVR
ncbi:hypothetical protein TI39_contig279g00054 [Zymoseptoria brevis]|uniref:ChrR-like cupin domain-containing protein n=1 Tax=Zymoseptoria brevis TaxID=1047168 RepID=A0A0F4GWG6_9PEZI|nr:hypothetical protein TI39_contig279g00054 [Zymoseptoria brevis]